MSEFKLKTWRLYFMFCIKKDFEVYEKCKQENILNVFNI